VKYAMPLLALIGTALVGCQENTGDGTLSQNVGASFAPCSEAEIKYMAARHNVMTAFKPCGANKFSYYSWSPSGRHLYFQLVMTGYIMDADSPRRQTAAVPTPTPIGPAAWISASRIVVPVGPAAEDETESLRLAVYDLEQSSVMYTKLPELKNLRALQRQSESTVLLIADSDTEVSAILSVDLVDGAVSKLGDWVKTPAETMTYTPTQDVLTVGQGQSVTAYKLTTKETIGTWEHATRGSMHPHGTWMALEFLGDEISIFNQRSWNELSEKARARELARVKQFEERLPDSYATSIRPPTISLVDMSNEKRTTITGVLGDQFQWYEAKPSFMGLMLWGFEGKQYKRNVVLGNLDPRMRAIQESKDFIGLESFHPPIRQTKEAPQ
jgi:hypothetical protein